MSWIGFLPNATACPGQSAGTYPVEGAPVYTSGGEPDGSTVGYVGVSGEPNAVTGDGYIEGNGEGDQPADGYVVASGDGSGALPAGGLVVAGPQSTQPTGQC